MEPSEPDFNAYLQPDFTPNSKTAKQIYPDAMRELGKPYPSTRIHELPMLDMITGGFRVKEFSILCGATGVGKTSLVSNLSAALLAQQVPHYVASVETGANDFLKRVLCVFSNQDLNHGDAIDAETLKKLHVQHGQTAKSDLLSLSLYDNRFSVEELMSDITWHVKHRGIKVAFIDNLNFFLEVKKSNDLLVEMDRVTHELVIFCKRIPVHVVMVMHPKKTDGGRVESEFDVKGSSTAVQEAHNIFLFNRPHPDLIKNKIALPGDRELKIVKMRRRGKHVGKRLLFGTPNGVKYFEKVIL